LLIFSEVHYLIVHFPKVFGFVHIIILKSVWT